MNRSPRIKPFEATSLAALKDEPYASVLASLGYEHRSRQIPEALGVQGLAVAFGDHHEFDYEHNKAFFEKANWQMPEIPENQFYAQVSDWLGGLVKADQPVRIAADVSSMSRRRIADLVEAVFALPKDAHLDVDFLYTPAEFAEPEPDLDPLVISVSPVSDAFAGWWDDLDKPLHAIVGLGYEKERAASALDVLEPRSTQIYVPEGNDPRYLDAVSTANQGLDEMPGVLPSRVHYPVVNPFACFQGLEAAVGQLAASDRIALIPLGPKIFALIATITAALHPSDVQVIRVTSGLREAAHQRHSDGTVCGLTVSLRPPPEAPEQDETD